MKVLRVILALVGMLVIIGAGSAPASQSVRTAATSSSAGSVGAAVDCRNAGPPAGYYAQGAFPDPNRCAKCRAAGAAWEAMGGYKAYCRDFPNASTRTAWLYIFCQKCREGEGSAAPAIPSMADLDRVPVVPTGSGLTGSSGSSVSSELSVSSG